jgi:hypothetical protein
MNEKPKILYHGTMVRGIKKFEPRVSKGYGEKFGPLVYATHDFGVAVVFTMNAKSTWHTGVSNGVTYVLITDPKEEFIKNDKGGTVYVFANKGFEVDPKRGMGNFEWASKNSVLPIDTINIQSSLQAMMDEGIQVYFTDKKKLEEVESADYYGLRIIKDLVSENIKVGKNVKPIPVPS